MMIIKALRRTALLLSLAALLLLGLQSINRFGCSELFGSYFAIVLKF